MTADRVDLIEIHVLVEPTSVAVAEQLGRIIRKALMQYASVDNVIVADIRGEESAPMREP